MENWRDVFNNDPPGPNFANDADVFIPESASVASQDSGPLAGDGQIDARESANDAIHKATPRLASESVNVAPDRSFVQFSFRHTRRQASGRRRFDLHVARRASLRDCTSDSAVEPASAAEQTDVGR
jgi:hypothetical protein